MKTFVLDSSAALRYIDDGPGAGRVEELLSACAKLQVELTVSAVQWGEIAGKLRKRFGASEEMRILSFLVPSEACIVPADSDRAVRAAGIKVDRNLAYADAFALELAMGSPDHVLVTADYGFKVAEDLVKIEFLPSK